MPRNDNSHINDPFSSDQTDDSHSTNANTNNSSSSTKRLRSHPSLDRLHIPNLTISTPASAPSDEASSATPISGTSDDSPNVNTNLLRAKGITSSTPRVRRPSSNALCTSMCSTIEAQNCTGLKGLSRRIHRHYSRIDYIRSEKQLEREKFLIGKIPFSRWLFLPAAFGFQAVCGTLYAWSVFNTLIDNELYGNADGTPANAHKAAITFYIALGCFGVSSSIMGPWLERHGPRKAGLLGATLFLLGNLTTALGIYLKQISLVYIGYGIFGGLGLGISYISPVSALQKWFPDRRGVAAGLAVSGFGAGSIVMAKVPDPLSAAVGLPLTFVILGLAYFLVMAVCAFVFRVPPPGYIVNGVNVWAIRVDVDEEANEVHSSENHDQGLSEITIDERQSSSQPNSCSRVFIENKGEAPAISSILHTLHPLQRSLNSQKSMDDFLVPPISPVSNTTTVLPSALNSASNSRRSSTHTAAMHASLDPSISMNLMDSLYSREFRLMYIMFLGNTMAGVVIISRLANIATDIFGHSKNSASTIVSINGGFNLLGRLLFASISDKIGRKSAYMVMLGCQAIALATLPVIMQESVDSAFLLTIWLLTSCYGGGFGCIPAFLCDMFGPSNIGPLHGVILTSWSLSSVGAGLLFTGVYNYLLENGYTIHDSFIYAVNLYWMLGCVCVGVLVAIFVRVDMLDRLLPSLPGEYFHARILRRIVRFGQFGIQKMTQEQEQQAWTNYVAHRQMEEEHALNSNEKGRI